MRIETLTDRIANAKAKIEKKGNTITKKQALIEKKKATLVKMGFNPNAEAHEVRMYSMDAFWLICDIKHLREDIERINDELKETQASLEKYEAQMAGEIERESLLIKEIPESMKRMQTELVETWDAWDIERRARLQKAYEELGYRGFFQKYNRMDYEFRYMTDEQIHKSNEQDAKNLIINLYYRVREITGEVTDWSGIHAEVGTYFGACLNGVVIGKQGRARVESILAGGYNIQRLHVRVLVHEI